MRLNFQTVLEYTDRKKELEWMDGLRRVEPLLIEAELLHAGLYLGLMCSSSEESKNKKNI
jgi:hypothetical protein